MTKISAAKGGPLLVAVVFAALAFRLFRLTSQYAVNIFFWDQWDFNDAALFEHRSLWQIFRFQHGPHRQGLGGILAALVDPWFRWNSRTEAFLATALVAIAALGMLYLKYRLFGAISWTDAAIPMIAFTPAAWEALWTTVNFAHGTLPVLLIVLYCIVWTWRNERTKYALITLLNFVTLYTGFGLFIGLLTPVLLFARYRENRKSYILTCLVVSIACLASFFVGYKNEDASGCASLFSASPVDYFRFLCLMFATPLGIRGTGVLATVAGFVVLAGVAAIAAVSWKRVLTGARETNGIVLAVLSAYYIVFCVACALGRTCTGLDDAHASRYGNYRQLAVLCLFFAVLSLRPRLVAWVPILLIPSLFMTAKDEHDMLELYVTKTGWRACYLAGNSIDICDDRDGAIHPDPLATHLQEKLDFLRATRQNLFVDSSRR